MIDIEQLKNKAEADILKDIELRMVKAIKDGKNFIELNDSWLNKNSFPNLENELKNFKVEQDDKHGAYLMYF